jgi:hypothetical protein
MNNTVFQFVLLFTLLLAGFYGGTGFFVVMGGNPAIGKMSSATFAEYWQHTDYFMAARMPFFGPILILSVITSTIFAFINENSSAGFLIAALGILVADMIVIFGVCHPLNQLIQSWDLNKLPLDVQKIKHEVIGAFWLRSACMIGTFLCVILALWKSKLIVQP